MQGRSPTCYSPVRHSSTPEGAFPFDLHVLSTPPAFVLSQDQTLQTKTPGQTGQNPNQKNLTKQPEKSGIKKTSTPKREKEADKNNKQKPPNTLLSSQTTCPCFGQPCQLRSLWLGRSSPVLCCPLVSVRTRPVGFWRKYYALSRKRPNGQRTDCFGAAQRYATRSISAPRPTRFSTNRG